jgi:hypothetical protein
MFNFLCYHILAQQSCVRFSLCERYFLKNRLDGPLKAIMGKIYDKNAPGFWRNDKRVTHYVVVFSSVPQ